MNKIEKTAVFLFMIGLEKAGKIMALMDSDELKKVLNVFGKVSDISTEVQQEVLQEFAEIGYSAEMSAVEILYVIRQLFGGKISDQEKPRLYLI